MALWLTDLMSFKLVSWIVLRPIRPSAGPAPLTPSSCQLMVRASQSANRWDDQPRSRTRRA